MQRLIRELNFGGYGVKVPENTPVIVGPPGPWFTASDGSRHPYFKYGFQGPRGSLIPLIIKLSECISTLVTDAVRPLIVVRQWPQVWDLGPEGLRITTRVHIPLPDGYVNRFLVPEGEAYPYVA